jgi:MSHA biogenesis protein MshN
MSVINKMLQDLDARGLQTARSDFSNVRSVPEGTRRLETNVLIGLGGVAAVALVGLAAWHYSAAPVVAVQPLVQLAVVAPVAPLESPAPLEDVTLAPVPPVVRAAPETKVVDAAPTPKRSAPAATRSSAPAAPRVAESRSKPRSIEGIERIERPVQRIARIEAQAPVAERSEPRARRSAGSAAVADNALQMKQANPRQEAENEYRRALGLVQEGRVTAGISGLEQTLRIFPRHDAARQTLIGLLLESRRPDEAMQQLEQGLTLDAGQTAMAMTLARLQVERNGPALQTLQRSLPHAQDNAEYQGFIGALLQREQRHKEAIEHYTSALRMHPKNGIWWMGLGISLQADQRLPDARVAFQKAKASGSLDGELPNFVDKKLQQLGR